MLSVHLQVFADDLADYYDHNYDGGGGSMLQAVIGGDEVTNVIRRVTSSR